jgi:hypothetical protein
MPDDFLRLQMVASVASGIPATEFIRLDRIEMVSELRLVHHVALRCVYVVLDISRQAMIALGVRAMPPSRGLLETNSFWAVDCRGYPDTLIDL